MLNRLALRLCVVQALIGKTFAQTAVKDSLITPVNTEIPDEKAPFIAVYTDDQGAEGLRLTIEVGVTASMAVRDADSGHDVIIASVPPTDAGIEMSIDAIERQIHTALSDPLNPWAELYRALLQNPGAPESRRGASAKDGERYAGRQIEIVGKPLADPAFGRAAGGFWQKFLDAMDAQPELADHAVLVRSLLGVDETPAAWRVLQRAIDGTQADVDSLGFGPVEGADADTVIGGVASDATPDAS